MNAMAVAAWPPPISSVHFRQRAFPCSAQPQRRNLHADKERGETHSQAHAAAARRLPDPMLPPPTREGPPPPSRLSRGTEPAAGLQGSYWDTSINAQQQQGRGQRQQPKQLWRPQRAPPRDSREQQRCPPVPPAHGSQKQQPRLPPAGPCQLPLVVVEGLRDMHAVHRAVGGSVDVYVLGTATAADSPRVLQDLQAASKRYPAIIVLTDPDVAGRHARTALDQNLPGCLHAFLPSPLATAITSTTHHSEGNIGVEHAAPAAIRAALSAPRRSDPERGLFSREQLQDMGLAAEMHVRGSSVTRRRSLACAYLGLGDCDGKQLLRQLNRYCFTTEEVAAAVRWADQQTKQLGLGR